jgi:hypothetical protein
MAHSTLLPTLPAEVVPEGEPPLLLLHLLATLVSLALTYVPSHPSRFSFVSFLLEPPPSSFLSSLLPSVLPALPHQIAGALPLLCSLLPLSLLHSVAKPLHLPPAAHDLINCAFAAHWLSKTTLLTTVLSHALVTSAVGLLMGGGGGGGGGGGWGRRQLFCGAISAALIRGGAMAGVGEWEAVRAADDLWRVALHAADAYLR